MKIVLIRHGATPGNAERRYVGTTDESLSADGRAGLCSRVYPSVEQVFISPMKRCAETAALIYPSLDPVMVDDFRECNFGAFEYRSYAELKDVPAYQTWLSSGGTLPFPGGESRAAFSRRCCEAFLKTLQTATAPSIAIVAHGGTLMAIMERFAIPKKEYYDYQVGNGEGFCGMWEENRHSLAACRPLTT